MTGTRSRTPSETPTNDIESGTTISREVNAPLDVVQTRQCAGCGRQIWLDPRADGNGTYWWRLEGGTVKHDEVACVRSHDPRNVYAGTADARSPAKKLPRVKAGRRGSRWAREMTTRRTALLALGVVVPNRRAVHKSEKASERVYCSVAPLPDAPVRERWV